MSTGNDLLAQAKQRLPLSALMAQLGYGDRAKKSARCPFHEDSSASFSLYVGDDGEEHWKCFAGCGQGDAIDFLAKVHGLSNADACREFIRLAGVTPPAPAPAPQSSAPVTAPPFDWEQCVAAFTATQQAKLAAWRGISPGLVAWVQCQKLIGLLDGERIAFPLHAPQGNVIACHSRSADGCWCYFPKLKDIGARVSPLIIGDIAQARIVSVFESQWDLLAFLDLFHWHIEPLEGVAVVATRGAANGKLLAGLCAPGAMVHAFTQADAAGATWLASVAANCGCKCLNVPTPEPFKDLNEWTKAGTVAADIDKAIAAAQIVTVSTAPDLHAAPPAHVSKPAIVLPPEDEADTAGTAPTFPVDSLPPKLAAVITATARCERVPAALPAVCALGVASAAIGAGLEIVSASDRVTRANLYVLADAESGSGKSQVFRRIAEPIVEHQRQLHESFREKTAPQLASEIGLLTREVKRMEGKAAKSDDPAERQRMLAELEYKRARLAALEQKNAPPCVICVDVTSEKLAVLLAANRETLFSASPEARQIVDIVCGRYNSTKSTDEAIYLSAFSGDFLRVDRLGREPLTLRKPCLSALWLVQPDAMARLFETGTLAQSGFLPRFLACRTQAAPKKIVEGEAQAISESVRGQWTGLITDLLATYHAVEKPYRIEPTPEAKRLLDDFFNAVVDRRAGELSDVGQFASRYAEQAWRVALTFHAALYGRDAHNHPLDAETAQSALVVVQWFIPEQLGILAKCRRQAAAELDDAVLQLLADRIQGKRLEKEEREAGRPVDYVTARNVHRARITPSAEAAKALLARMEADGLVVGEDITPPHGGKTTRIYRHVQNPVPE